MAGVLASCTTNPFFSEWKTPYGVPPFDEIKNEHYMPAFEKGMEQLQTDINKIAENTEAPTFENTIVAMDNAGALLSKHPSALRRWPAILKNKLLKGRSLRNCRRATMIFI